MPPLNCIPQIPDYYLQPSASRSCGPFMHQHMTCACLTDHRAPGRAIHWKELPPPLKTQDSSVFLHLHWDQRGRRLLKSRDSLLRHGAEVQKEAGCVEVAKSREGNVHKLQEKPRRGAVLDHRDVGPTCWDYPAQRSLSESTWHESVTAFLLKTHHWWEVDDWRKLEVWQQGFRTLI